MSRTPQTLNIVQYNVNKSRNRVMSAFLQAVDPKSHHILAFQEPWKNPQMPTTLRSPNYHLVYPPHVDTRVCFFVSKVLDRDCWETKEHSPDLLTLTLRTDNKTLHIHNCYNQPPKLATSRYLGVLQRLPEALNCDGEHILLGDFNLHHPSWGGVLLPTQHALADDLIDITIRANLQLTLPPGSITWRIRHSMSTLDLVFATGSTAGRIQQCRPCEELDSDSDHVPVITSIEMEIPTQPERPARPQWKRAEWVRVRETLEQKIIDLELVASTCHADLDDKARRLQDAIQETIELTIPKGRPSHLVRIGWTPECKEATCQARRARRRWTRSGLDIDYVAYRTATNSKKRQIRLDTRATWRQTVAHITEDPKKMWKLAKWARTSAAEPPAPPQFPPLKDRDGTHQSSNDVKADILAKHFFPPAKAADLSDIADHRYPSELPMLQTVSAEEVIKVLKALPPDKAPGPDGIPNRVLRECRGPLSQPLASLFQECLEMSYHPAPFRHSNTVVLRKPQKPCYDVPKEYRPIALLNTLGKTLEKIVATRLSKLVEEHHLLPATQMGARPGRSTVTALELLTEQIRTVWVQDKKLVATLLSLDISGAFDNVSHERLLHNVRNAGIPDWTVQYIKSFLTDRTTFLTLGTYSDKTRPVSTGIPQGSTLSPILFLFFASTLLPQLNSGFTSAVGFVDDTNILTFGRSTEENCRTLEGANEICIQWAKTHGATFAPEKYQLIHFTPRLKKFNLQATIRIPGFQGGPSPVVRILGVHLDSRLKWGPHIRQTATKAMAQMSAITRLTQSTWGASFAKARQIYAAVVRPVLAYGCEVWYDPEDKRVGRNKLTYPLQTIQNKCLRTVTGAYKTTNVQILEHEASIPPLDLHLERLAVTHALRTTDTDGSRTITQACDVVEERALRTLQIRMTKPLTKVEQLRGRIEDKPAIPKKFAKVRMENAWAQRWQAYRATREGNGTSAATAQTTSWNPKQCYLHRGLLKAESTLATLLRTEHIGLNDYLYRRGVPDCPSPLCECGWPRQTVKHIVLFCPRYARDRDKMIQEARSSDLATILSTENGIRAVTRWFLRQDILTQFSVAREALEKRARAPRRQRGRRAGNDVDDG